MASVTFRSGLVISDDSNPSTGLAGGGHRTRFVPALAATLATAQEAKDWASKIGSVVFDDEYSAKEYAIGLLTASGGSAKGWATKTGSTVDAVEFSAKEYAQGELSSGSAKAWASGGVLPSGFLSAKQYAEDALLYRDGALQAPGTSATSTTTNTIGTGSRTFTIQTNKLFQIGSFVIIASTGTPSNYMIGQVTLHTPATGSLTVNVTTVNGTGSFSNWVISYTALANLAGAALLTGTQTFTGTNTFTNAVPIISAKIGPSGTQQHTLPAVTSDTVILSSATQNLTNKSISLSNISGGNADVSRVTTTGNSAVGTTTVTAARFTVSLLTDNLPLVRLSSSSNNFDFRALTNSIANTGHRLDINATNAQGELSFTAGTTQRMLIDNTGELKIFTNATSNDGVPKLSQVNSLLANLNTSKNRIVNGDFLVRQRPSQVFTNTIGGSNKVQGYGGPDYWFVQSLVGTGCVLTQASSFMSLDYAVRQTINTAATSVSGANSIGGISQRMTWFDVYDLNNRTITISFLFRSNVTGNFSISLRTNHAKVLVDEPGTKSYVSTFSYPTANTIQRVSLTVQIPQNSISENTRTGLVLNIGGIATGDRGTASLNTWLTDRDAFASTTGVNWATTANNFIEVAKVQLEENSSFTEFESRSYWYDYDLCRRIYTIVKEQVLLKVSDVVSFGGNITNFTFPEMLSTPTISAERVNGSSIFNITLSASSNSGRLWFGLGTIPVGEWSSYNIFLEATP